MPVTILDYVKSQVGEKDSYPAADFHDHGVAIIGGCELCGATLGPYNAYPSATGCWRCGTCIGNTGYHTVAEFKVATWPAQPDDDTAITDDSGIGVLCTECQDAAHIIEIRSHVFECGDCGATWSA
jgi:hypothetical protein